MEFAMTDDVEMRPFDPGEPFDAMADSFRTQVAKMAIEASDAAIFRDLTPVEQVQCLMAGVLTGLAGVCFSYVSEDGREAIAGAMRDTIDFAAANAAHIIENGKKP